MTYTNGSLLSDFKLRRTQKTIEHLLQYGAAIKLVTHQEPVDGKSQSTKPLLTWFSEHKYPILFSPTLNAPVPKNSIMLCENIRFFEGEKSKDSQLRTSLAHDLQANTDYYIFDGFGVAHRNDTSVATAPLLFTPEHRSIGFLVQEELEHIYPLITSPDHPFFALCSGNKQEKLDYLNKIQELDTILLGPALSLNITASEKVIIPRDYLPGNSSIGPQTTIEWSNKLKSAGTVLCNGLMGFLEHPETLKPFDQVLDAIARSRAYTVIAGGSTTSYIDYKKLTEKFSFCSTGGGATLAYLAQEKLPGLEPLL
jgi:phosphoglycerate kinase